MIVQTLYKQNMKNIIYILIFLVCIFVIYFVYNFVYNKLIVKKQKQIYDVVYLINLKRRPDRLKKFLELYNESDMKDTLLIKFDAIDGSKLDINSVPLSELAKAELNQLESTGFRTKHYQLTKGGIGCYLSHVKIWENILKHNYKYALIFEDDAKVPHNINEIINEELKYFPNDWDIILLGYICNKCMKFKNYNTVERFMLTHCYLISYECIVKIMNTDTLFPITQQIDALMSELSSILNIYSVKEKKVKQFSSRTDIQAPLYDKNAEDVHDRIKVLEQKL